MTHQAPHNEWNELDAAVRSEELLERAYQGDPGPCSGEDIRRIERDAMRAMAVGIPDPCEFARWLETAHHEAAFALCSAYRSTNSNNYPYLRVEDGPQAPLLRSLGLIEVGGFGVGAFGNSVRKFMLGEVE